jgi:hypothetical protein
MEYKDAGKRASNEARQQRTNWPAIGWGAFPVLISLIALVVSVEQSRFANEETAASVYNRTANVVLEKDRAYLENYELRPYFYQNRHLDESDPKADKVKAMAELTLDCFQMILAGIDANPHRYSSPEEDRAWILDSFKHSEVLRDYVAANRRGFSNEMLALRDKAASEFK